MAAGRASCPPAIPPGRRSLRGEASQHHRRRRRQQQPSAVARSSARRPPLPPSPLRAHALTAVAAVAVAAVAVAAVAAARLLRRCGTGRRLLAAATPAAPLSITRRSSPPEACDTYTTVAVRVAPVPCSSSPAWVALINKRLPPRGAGVARGGGCGFGTHALSLLLYARVHKEGVDVTSLYRCQPV